VCVYVCLCAATDGGDDGRIECVCLSVFLYVCVCVRARVYLCVCVCV